jgi:hypothetical protein
MQHGQRRWGLPDGALRPVCVCPGGWDMLQPGLCSWGYLHQGGFGFRNKDITVDRVTLETAWSG